MNIVLWIIQILLALLFLFAGITKLFPTIIPMPPPPDAWMPPMWFLKFIGVCELLGGLGLVLPGLFRTKQLADADKFEKPHRWHPHVWWWRRHRNDRHQLRDTGEQKQQRQQYLNDPEYDVHK